MNPQPLVDQPVTDHDWQQHAWNRLRSSRPRLRDITLGQALDDEGLGPIVRGFAAQLRREHEAKELALAKEARYGRKVEHNGYGYRPVRHGRR